MNGCCGFPTKHTKIITCFTRALKSISYINDLDMFGLDLTHLQYDNNKTVIK